MDSAHLTEDEMAEIKKEAIERLRPYLVDKIIAERHFDYLRSKKILTREDTEEISCRTTRGRRTSKLLDILAENPRGLDVLIESIKWGRTLNFIIAKITDEVQRVKNERLEALKGSSASSGYSCTKVATSDLSKMDNNYDKCSTICYHPDGERSPSTSVATESFNLRHGSGRGNEALSPCGGTGSMNVSTTTSSSLPKPGDPGAPALPEELEEEEVQDIDTGVCGSTGSSGDANFQPLRSRSLSPQIP
ncbi:B-cell lymphoma/leukemia 10-like isoform X2 [Myxocyprinus asiaticus]|uniref:B-cell lymphoma/leukemia 10-like isoform X2 n=1 Tax=Myxocyprinus asiaticus TaxID=70543 RepID=UPI00222203C2|nr:B-cell lymphoma/leukemia 10-like isoform X2 [Myxocyprinus asiaticus]